MRTVEAGASDCVTNSYRSSLRPRRGTVAVGLACNLIGGSPLDEGRKDSGQERSLEAMWCQMMTRQVRHLPVPRRRFGFAHPEPLRKGVFPSVPTKCSHPRIKAAFLVEMLKIGPHTADENGTLVMT